MFDGRTDGPGPDAGLESPEHRIHRFYGLVSHRFRRARMQRFQELVPVTPETRVLDVGGTIYNWEYAPVRPRLTFVNIGPRPGDLEPEVEYVRGDAMELPFKAGAFDVVYSNSVIEHLKTDDRQRAMAEEIRRVGRRYFVQTPDVSFPIEPHLLTPFIHWVPRRWRWRLIRNFSVWGWVTRPTTERCREFVEEVRLLGRSEVRALFPNALIISERLAGLSKSLLAVRSE